MQKLQILFLASLLSGCSVFQTSTQQLTIVSKQPESKLFVNGEFKGIGRATLTVPRDESVVIKSVNGSSVDFDFVQTVPSLTGKLDQAGAYFLVPSIGLFFPGSVELEKNYVIVE